MKTVILAGGFGTRLSEVTDLMPKPMVEIDGRPILWHIMKIYSSFGYNDFVILLGYKGYMIKEYFTNYFLHMSDVTFDMKDNSMQVHQNNAEQWTVTLVDTGENTMTGGRLKSVKNYVKNEQAFCFTYGDGVGNVDITALIQFHQSHGKQATLTATRPPGRYGALKFGPEDSVESFQEKPEGDGSWINGGYFVIEPEFFNLIEGDETILERQPLERVSEMGELMAYYHDGFWKCMGYGAAM